MNDNLLAILQTVKLGEYLSSEVSAEIDDAVAESYPGASFRIEASEVEQRGEAADLFIDGRYKLFLKSPDENNNDKVVWLWRRVK